ncbi:MAG: arginase family protein [Promethearchaeota archaeon]
MAPEDYVDEFQFTGIEFGDFPSSSLARARVVVFGIPMNLASSFEGDSREGPGAIRRASSELVETYLLDYGVDLADVAAVHDLGDLPVPGDLEAALELLARTVPKFVRELRAAGKVPLCLGGEHTVTYYLLEGMAPDRPVVVHLDAHMDYKPEYGGHRLCHATPFYHAREFVPGADLIQVGIRQADQEEARLAAEGRVTSITAWDVRADLGAVVGTVRERTRGRPVYLSFDVDVLDAPYTPATGTPVSFGLTPGEVLSVVGAISGEVVGVDCVEVGLDPNYREAEVATQVLFRVLAKIHGYSPT